MSAARETPGFFGPADRPLFGWVNGGGEGVGRGRAIVFCNPLGYEAISCHRLIRNTARLAAQLGFATLRFDYDGCGDSAGSDADPERLAAWLASVHSAIDQLRSVSGVRTVCLWGIRFGATLAALAARDRPDVNSLVAVVPILSGRRYLRELRTLALTSDAPPQIGDTLEAAGFCFTAATCDALRRLSLPEKVPALSSRVLIYERDDLPAKPLWLQTLCAGGTTVQQESLRGYAQLMRDAHEAQSPPGLLQASLAWILDGPAAEAPGPIGSRVPAIDRAVVGGGCRECAVQVGDRAPLFALVSEPDEAVGTARPLVLLLNAGSVNHVGPSRLHVTLARTLASRGVRTARLDLPGLGDSAAHSGAVDNLPYPPSAVEDIVAATTALRERFPTSTLQISGICSGAYHALKCCVAVRDLRGVIPINPLTFHWTDGMRLDMPAHVTVSEGARYLRTMLSWKAWRKSLRGEARIRAAIGVLCRRSWSQLEAVVRDLGRACGLKWRDDLGTELLQIAARRVKLSFIFSASDPGLTMLQEQGGRPVQRLLRAGALHVTRIMDADHTFSWHGSRLVLIRQFQLTLGVALGDAIE